MKKALHPDQNTTECAVSHNISWIGPQQMATWRITGYVADSEDEDQDIDIVFQHHKASQRSQKGENHDGDGTSSGDVPVLGEGRSLLENFQPYIKQTPLSSPITEINTALKKHVEEDTRHPDEDIQLESRFGQELKEQNPTERTIANPAFKTQLPTDSSWDLETSAKNGQPTIGNVTSPLRDFSAAHLDDLDSPLSTPPDSPIPIPVHASSLAEERPASPVLASDVHASSRSFRPRKAIQINPYLLDYAKHQKEWGERGLKPVHIPRVSSPERRTHEEESQEFASRDDSQASKDLVQESMELDELDQRNDLASFDTADDDLPDLDILLREDIGRPRQRLKQKTRPRKSNGSMSTQLDIFDLPLDEEMHHQPTKVARHLNAPKQNSFPSPPRSTSSSSAGNLLSSNSEIRVSTKPLTPTTSSGFRARRRRVIEDDSQSQTGVEKAPMTISSSEHESESSETEAEPEEVRIMQRKLRGVLPASVMTIQKAQQEMNRRRHEAAQAAARSAPGPGVAERKLNKTIHRQSPQKPVLNWYEDLMSENEDSEADADQAVLARHDYDDEADEGVAAEVLLQESFEAVETMDDDGIDRMLPARPRSKAVRAKQQPNLKHISVPNFRQRKRRRRDHDAASASTPRKRTKQTRSGNVVHVHDAPGLSPQITARPSWLRIAARQARRTKASGTTTSKKFFQLDEPEETKAVLSEMNQRTRDLSRKRIKVAGKAPQPEATRRNKENVPDPPKTPRGAFDSRQPYRVPPLQSPYSSEVPLELPHETQENLVRQADDAALRLTRLRSLLPLKNRAGRGRFVHKASEPRAAQVEEVRQSYTGLSHHTLRQPPTIVRQSQRSVDWSARPASASRQSSELARPEGTPQRRTLPNAPPSKGSRQRKKQTPVYRPILHQTLLVPLAQDTARLRALLGQTDKNVRMVLEREFVTHQAEWFQGRKDGIVCANEATQRHFRVFLEVLGSYLSATLNNSNDARDVRELRSFIYRLVPNRGSIGAQGQVGDKTMDVLEFDILVAKNVFDLHVCLLNLAPAYAPLPRVLETKVNFADAHNELCLIALSAWQAICDYHHTQHFVADGLSNWLYLILTQLVSRWKAAESDARAEAERSVRRVEEQIIRKVIEHNRAQASDLMITALNGLVHGIEYATGLGEADSLLNLQRYTEIVANLVKLPDVDRGVLRAMLKVASSYTKQWLPQSSSSILPLLSCLRQVVTAFTSYQSTPLPELLFFTIQGFFFTAYIAVSHRQKSWDDFFVPTSSFSLNMFVSGNYQDTSKALFYHFLLENDQNAYLLDFRGAVLSQWLRVLLQSRFDEASALLTCSILNREKDSLSIPSLAASFHPPGSTFTVSAVRDILPEIRHAATMHVIADLSGQENNAEAEWLPGGLDEVDAIRLLKTIFTTLKETWTSLSEKPEEQDIYTVLVHAALDQYEVHSRSDFTIEPWFSNSAVFPQRRKHSLAQLFAKRNLSDVEFIYDATEVMQQEVAHARRFGRMDVLAEELQELLLPRTIDTAITSQSHNYTTALFRHILFVRDVLPHFIKPTPSTPNDTTNILLTILIHIASTIECRTSPHNVAITKDFTNALTTILSVLSDQLSLLNTDDRAKVYTLTLLTFELSATAGDALSDGFIGDVGRICDFAVRDEAREGVELLAGIVGWM